MAQTFTYYLRGGIKGVPLQDLSRPQETVPIEKVNLPVSYYKLPPLLQSRIHREDGPAIIYPDNSFEWFYNGKQYSFEEWCEKLNITEGQKMLLQLTYL